MKQILALFLSFTFLSFGEEHTQLGKHMDELNGHLKSLRRLEDTDWAGKAEAIQKAQQELVASIFLEPTLISELPEEEKMKQMALYKKHMADAFVALVALETALLNEDEDAADDLIRSLKKIKKYGHTDFVQE